MWAIAGKCTFCGTLIVFVEKPGGDKRRDLPIFLSTWDGNPVYDRHVHQLHKCRLRQKLLRMRERPRTEWFT